MADFPIAFPSQRPPSTTAPPALPPTEVTAASTASAVESARALVTHANRPDFSPTQARTLAAELRTLARAAGPALAAQLEGEAAALDQAAAAVAVVELEAGQRATPAADRRQHALAVQQLDVLFDVHVAPGRPAATVMGYVLRDAGPEGLLQLAGRVGVSDVVQAATRHGASPTEAHALAERMCTNAAEAYHAALLERVVGGLRARLSEVRAAGSQEHIEATVDAVLRRELDLSRHLTAVGRASEARELAGVVARFADAAPREQAQLRASARALIEGGLGDIEAVLAQQVELVAQFFRIDAAMELPRYFAPQAVTVARESGLTQTAARGLGSGSGSTLLERALSQRAEAARRVRSEQSWSRAANIVVGDVAGWVPGRPGEVAALVTRSAEAAVAARERGLMVGAYLLSLPLAVP